MFFFVIYKIEVFPGTYLHPPKGEGKGWIWIVFFDQAEWSKKQKLSS